MALVVPSSLVILLLAGGFAAASFSPEFSELVQFREPECDEYKLPGCPRDFSPVCGSDMTTYPNECTLCMKIRESGTNLKVDRSGPC